MIEYYVDAKMMMHNKKSRKLTKDVLNTTDYLDEKIGEIEALSDYYDDIFSGTAKDNLAIGKEKMKYIRAQILKKTFELKNMLRKLQIEMKGR